jgi:arsenate reductase
MITVYGIPNCDTIKKTRDWLENNKIEYEFHDYKKSGISKTKLSEWCKKVGWEILLNKKSSTWRNLSAAEQQTVTNQPAAVKVMMENNSIIKRPVIENAGVILVGYNEEEFIKQLKIKK